MIVYYLWALAEKGLSVVPGGKHLYTSLGYAANKNTRGKSGSFVSSFRLARMGKELIPAGGTVLDVGTGWYHHDALLLYLVGDYEIVLFDIEDKARLRYIQNYLQHMLTHMELISTELDIDPVAARAKIERLLPLDSKEAIYEACHFSPIYPDDPTQPFLPEGTFDFMTSNCVLNHIPLPMLLPELGALKTMLKDDGSMYFLIGHDDHWTFHDKSANQFNYYRYSDAYYRALFETKFEFQNRLVKQEWLGIFDQIGLRVDDYHAHITDKSREQIRALPTIDTRFAQYSEDDLAIIWSYVLLRKSEVGGAAGQAGSAAVQAAAAAGQTGSAAGEPEPRISA